MTTLTYDQALKHYQKSVKEMNAGYQKLVRDLECFLKGVRKSMETSEKAKEAKLLKKLENDLN